MKKIKCIRIDRELYDSLPIYEEEKRDWVEKIINDINQCQIPIVSHSRPKQVMVSGDTANAMRICRQNGRTLKGVIEDELRKL